MSWLGGAALAVGAVLIAEGYVLICRAQRFLTYAEQIGAALGLRLADLPGKSATRTDGSGTSPRIWWQRLRDLTVPDEPDTAPIADVITPRSSSAIPSMRRSPGSATPTGTHGDGPPAP